MMILTKFIDTHDFLYHKNNFAFSESERTSMAPLIKSQAPYYYMWADKKTIWIVLTGTKKISEDLKLFIIKSNKLKGSIELDLLIPNAVGKKVIQRVKNKKFTQV